MKQLQFTVYKLLFISLSVTILFFSKAFLIPLTLAGILAMLFTGIVQNLERRTLNRSLSSLIAILILLCGILLIMGLFIWRLSNFSGNITEMKDRALDLLENLKTWIAETFAFSSEKQEQLIKQQGSQSSNRTGNMLISFANSTVSVMVNTILVLVYTYLFLYYRNRIKQFILKLVPSDKELKAKKIIEEATQVSRHYLTGLAMMIVILWILYGIGFTLVGVENAVFFAVLCGILEIVPFIGNITGTSITVLAVVAQGGQTSQILGVIGVYLLIQFIQTYIIEPLVVGDQVNINPLFTIMALVAGESIWGIAGMVLAIPMLGIFKIICDHIPSLQPYGYLIGTDKKKRKKLFHKKD